MRDRLSWRKFTGLGFSDSVPDETTLVRFRQRLAAHGLIVREVTLVDATLVQATGAAYGYGMNLYLSAPPAQPPVNVGRLARPTDTALFADAAQVNDFQPPASRGNPMLEEFYYVDNPTNYPGPNYYPHAHFRHAQRANVLFGDGHVALEKPVPGSLDPKLPGQFVGRLRPEILVVP